MDDFRLRISQLVHDCQESWPFSQKFFSILNTFDYLSVFVDGFQNSSVNFLFKSSIDFFFSFNLYFQYIIDIFNTDKSSAIEEICNAFKHMIEEIFERIENVIIADVSKDFIKYKALEYSLTKSINFV